MITYSCGCVNEVHPCGVTRCVSKCEFHQDHAAHVPRGRAYYESLGVFEDGVPQCSKYHAELETPRTRLPTATHKRSKLLEVGGGVSMYAGLIQRRGHVYVGVEPDDWGARWTEATYGVEVHRVPFEKYEHSGSLFACVLACHVLEHFEDAPAMLRKMFDVLMGSGRLVGVVPDDEDMTNPDHRWFFNTVTLGKLLYDTGFRDTEWSVARIVKRESFIYFSARKPRS